MFGVGGECPAEQIGAGTLSSGNPVNQNNNLYGHNTVIKKRGIRFQINDFLQMHSLFLELF